MDKGRFNLFTLGVFCEQNELSRSLARYMLQVCNFRCTLFPVLMQLQMLSIKKSDSTCTIHVHCVYAYFALTLIR